MTSSSRSVECEPTLWMRTRSIPCEWGQKFNREGRRSVAIPHSLPLDLLFLACPPADMDFHPVPQRLLPPPSPQLPLLRRLVQLRALRLHLVLLFSDLFWLFRFARGVLGVCL